MTSESQTSSAVKVGIDDGFAYTKLALPDGRLLATPSRAQIGRSKVSWINHAERRIFEYATDGTVYSVGEVDAAATRFEGFSCSGMNRGGALSPRASSRAASCDRPRPR